MDGVVLRRAEHGLAQIQFRYYPADLVLPVDNIPRNELLDSGTVKIVFPCELEHRYYH